MKYSYILLVFLVLLLLFIFTQKKSGFNDVLDGQINTITPIIPDSYNTCSNDISLLRPDVPEERAFPLYGAGASMDRDDSNTTANINKSDSLHTLFKVNESIGESPFSQNINSRIIKIKDVGKQNMFNAFEKNFYTAAFVNNTILDNKKFVTQQYDDYNPSNNLLLESSPGSVNNSEVNCESTYPKVVNFNGMCLTEGDIPYEQIVNGKVNPRLVSRWESFTGQYDPNQVLLTNGLLYPVI